MGVGCATLLRSKQVQQMQATTTRVEQQQEASAESDGCSSARGLVFKANAKYEALLDASNCHCCVASGTAAKEALQNPNVPRSVLAREKKADTHTNIFIQDRD